MPGRVPTPMISVSFDRVREAIAQFRWRPEMGVEEIPAPRRIAPHAYAIEAELFTAAQDDLGSGRLIVLYDPAGNPAWHGDYRFVTLARADVDAEMAADGLLRDVCWTWLLEALDDARADFHDPSGTVTVVSSRSFGEISGQPDRAEVEIRASWTPELGIDLGVQPHLLAWQTLLCTAAGLPPLPEGVIPLLGRMER